MATFASLETLQLAGRQSLIIFVTMAVGRFRSSGLSAIVCQLFLIISSEICVCVCFVQVSFVSKWEDLVWLAFTSWV